MEKYTAIQSRVVWPCHLNDRGNLFGGEAMKWMDEVAYITAQRFNAREWVTVSVENIRFFKSIKLGEIANVTGRIVETGLVKLTMKVEIWKETPHRGTTEKAMEATFVFAAVDENERPVRL